MNKDFTSRAKGKQHPLRAFPVLIKKNVSTQYKQQKLLLRDISHELRSPLARMSASATLIQGGDK